MRRGSESLARPKRRSSCTKLLRCNVASNTRKGNWSDSFKPLCSSCAIISYAALPSPALVTKLLRVGWVTKKPYVEKRSSSPSSDKHQLTGCSVIKNRRAGLPVMKVGEPLNEISLRPELSRFCDEFAITFRRFEFGL